MAINWNDYELNEVEVKEDELLLDYRHKDGKEMYIELRIDYLVDINVSTIPKNKGLYGFNRSYKFDFTFTDFQVIEYDYECGEDKKICQYLTESEAMALIGGDIDTVNEQLHGKNLEFIKRGLCDLVEAV